MSDNCQAGPTNVWRIGRYRVGRYRSWQWECSDGCLGASGRTPLGALWRQLRWKREYRRNPRKYMIDGETP